MQPETQYQSRKSLQGISPYDAQEYGLLITLFNQNHERQSQCCVFDTDDVRKTVKDFIRRQFPNLVASTKQGSKIYSSNKDGTVSVVGTGHYIKLALRQTPYYPR